jgi:dihydrodipicolinate synthase/N-acetylneuraminate lyase
VRDYTRLADAGELDAARALSARLDDARDAFDRWLRRPWQHDRTIPIAQLKTWMALIGRPHGPVRPPRVPLAADQAAELRHDLERLELLR